MTATAHQRPHPVVDRGVDEASADELLSMATAALHGRRLAEVAELRLGAQWAILHGHPRDDRDPMVSPGGDGAPDVREYAIPEYAMARETHPATTRALIADALDLIHRLPRVWAIVVAGECEPWVARKVAVLSRPLSVASVRVVDAAVSRAIAAHAPSTVIQIAQAKVIEADPETHAAERERSRHERYVSVSRSDEFGYRHVISRTTAGDAAWIDGLVERVAEILAEQPDAADNPLRLSHNHDELRSIAFGWLARPVDLIKLLLDHTDLSGSRPVWAPDHLEETIQHLSSLTPRQLSSLRPRATLFVHVTDVALATRTGVARIEGVGPISTPHLADVFGHADVTVTQVLDLSRRRRADAYEHPERLKDQVWNTTGGDIFPFSPRTATRSGVDFDHVVPFNDTGPPGQTGTHNSAPLRRRHHRWKTHGGYRYHLVGHGRHLWQTPHGLCLLTDHRGTRRLTAEQSETMLAAPPGVEIYFSPAMDSVTLEP